MELRAFAEQVLFSTSLDEKLRPPPAGITDERPGPAIASPPMPGRPTDLRFKPTGVARDAFPGLQGLEQERERGRLLHFFANHELLATELMALVLLRFPEAPAAFRRGVLKTLQDEQEHTRLYLERMRACGIAFGEIPVSGYFWRCVAPMENPLDYVAGLSLTFEQANLDFARHFSQGFAAIGDAASAQLLDRIYRDEIGHVAYGLKWFRRWKNPDHSDWEAYCEQLKFPLSPRRAKGFALDPTGRRAAGLDEQFIAELDVFARSKGRTPGVFLFNPLAEGYIAQGAGFTPIKHQRQLAADLANLPQFLGREDDIVLVARRPGVDFLGAIKRAGLPLPEFVEFRAGQTLDLDQRKLGRLRPWAWSPDSVELLAPLCERVTGERRAGGQYFNPSIAALFGKAWSAAFLGKFLAQHDSAIGLCSASDVGVAVNTLEDALAAIAAIRARGHHRVVVKQSLGLAGHNAIRLFEPELLDPQRRWLERTLARGQTLVVEPWLERVRDFSVQLEMTASGLKVCGHTGLINDARGQFRANWAAPNFARRLPAAVVAEFAAPPGISAHLQHCFDELRSRLESELRAVGFLGPVGIDAFVYRGGDGQVRLKPVVEINPRYTMGRVLVELMAHAAPGSFGCFRLLTSAHVRAEGAADFSEYARKIRDRHPITREGEPVPKIRSGALCLNDPAQAQVCLAVWRIGRSLAEVGAGSESGTG